MATDSQVRFFRGRLARQRGNGFSLLEVVVAIGIFGFGIVVTIGLFAPLSRSVASNADAEAAIRLADALKIELQARVRRSGSFAPVLQLMGEGEGSSATPRLYASREGTRIGEREASVWNGASEQRFFEIALSRMEPLSSAVSGEPAIVLVYSAEIRWPAESTEDAEGRPTVLINGAIRR